MLRLPSNSGASQGLVDQRMPLSTCWYCTPIKSTCNTNPAYQLSAAAYGRLLSTPSLVPYLCVELVAWSPLQWVCQVPDDDVKCSWVCLQLCARIIIDQLKLGGLKRTLVLSQVSMAEVTHNLNKTCRSAGLLCKLTKQLPNSWNNIASQPVKAYELLP